RSARVRRQQLAPFDAVLPKELCPLPLLRHQHRRQFGFAGRSTRPADAGSVSHRAAWCDRTAAVDHAAKLGRYRMQVEQAIFTSTSQPGARGYQLVARSYHLREELAQTLNQWSPSQGGLLSADVEATG